MTGTQIVDLLIIGWMVCLMLLLVGIGRDDDDLSG